MIAPCGDKNNNHRGWRKRRPRALSSDVTLRRFGRIGLASVLILAAMPSRADIPVAVTAPFSGRHAAEGKALLQSVEWAIDAINARGGLGGERVVTRSEDDGCDERRAENAAAKLVQLKPVLVIGHPCGGPAQAAARIYAESGILFIATAPRHPDLTRRRAGPTIFRLAGRDDRQSASTAAYLAAAYAGKRLAIVHDRTRYARLLVDGLKRARGATDPTPIPEFGIVASSKDYAATVGALRGLRAEVVYFAGFPSEAAALWSQFRASDTPPDLIGSDALANADTELRALSAGARFVTRVLRPFTATDAVSAKPLSERLTAAGHQPFASALAAHAALEIWAGAVTRGGNQEVEAVARQFVDEPLQSVLGAIAFDPDGDARIPSFEIASFDDGQLTTQAIVLPSDRHAASKVETVMPAPITPMAPIATTVQRGVQSPVSPPLPVRHPLRRKWLRN